MGRRMPKTRVAFWREKLEGNRKRDYAMAQQLREEGWSVMVIWECETKPTRLEELTARIVAFLGR